MEAHSFQAMNLVDKYTDSASSIKYYKQNIKIVIHIEE